ncbi:MAG: excinuclease ABC subunit UvrA, partial [Actinobacteria bacterium]|nr:excinuclease ABC subunit UvrA [Actinomycetota bacterium]
VLQRLVDAGNTVLVIEHNLDVIKTADWVVDLGPEGGNGGGRVIAEGTPETVAKVAESYTGRFLADMLGIAEPGAPLKATKAAKAAKTAKATTATTATKPRKPAKRAVAASKKRP